MRNESTPASSPFVYSLPPGLPSELASALPKPFPWLFGGRYQPSSLLKTGQGITTFRALDHETKSVALLKVASRERVDTDARLVPLRDLETLKTLPGTLVQPPSALGEEAGLAFIARPWLSGTTLKERIQQSPLSLFDTLYVGSQMITALSLIHKRGVIHGNLKPHNWILDNQTGSFRLTLVDFGFGRYHRNEVAQEDFALTSLHYLSPEQAGLLFVPTDARSNLYSVGIIFFEMLTGRCPFLGSSIHELLSQHLNAEIPPLKKLRPDIPPALEQILRHLLEKDPANRYQTAEALLSDLKCVQGQLQHGIASSLLVPGARDKVRALREPSFVGRLKEKETLEKEIEATEKGNGRLLYLEGESGMGKSWLLKEVERLAEERGFLVLRSRATDRSLSEPLELFRELTHSLARFEGSPNSTLGDLKEMLREDLPLIATAIPEFATLFGCAAGDLGGPETLREVRIVRALTRFLEALGRKERPTLISLDDCQWADPLTLRVLAQWQRRRLKKHTPSYVTLMLASRPPEQSASESPLAKEGAAVLSLSAFAPDEVQAALSSMAGELPKEIFEPIYRLSLGNPFMASATLRGLVESRVLKFESESWAVEPIDLSRISSSLQSATLLEQRLKLLPSNTLSILSTAAVIGREFDSHFLASLLSVDEGIVQSSLDIAVERHFLWRAEEKRYVFCHDRLRESALGRLNESLRQELHAKIARALLVQSPQPIFELAFHFDAAGLSQLAIPFALRAGHESRARFSCTVAERYYRIAMHAVESVDSKTKLELFENLADVLLLQGLYEESAKYYENALTLANSSEESARLCAKVADLHYKRGDMLRAKEAGRRGLSLLKQWAPKAPASGALSLLWNLLLQTLHTCFPKFFLRKRTPNLTDDVELRARLIGQLSLLAWFENPLLCFSLHLHEMNDIERYAPTPSLASTYARHVVAMTYLPRFERGLRFGEKALEVAREVGDKWVEAQALSYLSIGRYGASLYREALESLAAAEKLFDRLGDLWERHFVSAHQAFCLYRLGECAQAAAIAKAGYTSACEVGDCTSRAILLSAWSKAAGGDLPDEIFSIEMERSKTDQPLSRIQILDAYAQYLLHKHHSREALEALEEAIPLIRRHRFRQEVTMAPQVLILTAIRQEMEKLSIWEGKRRASLQNKWKKHIRRADRCTRAFANNRPLFLREAAYYHSNLGNLAQAKSCLDESIAIARRQGARAELVESLRARAAFGEKFRWPEVSSDVTEAHSLLPPLSPSQALSPEKKLSASLSLADKFASLLELGRAICTTLSLEALLPQIRDAAKELFHAEHAAILSVNPDGTFRCLSQDLSKAEIPQSLLQEAQAQQSVILYSGSATQEATAITENPALLLIRSALCIPLFSGQKVAAVVYLEHRRVGNLYGENDRKLAAFLSTLSSTALENAKSFERLSDLNQALQTECTERERVESDLLAQTEQVQLSKKELEQFIYLTSHDLQQPLRMVRLYSQLLQKRFASSLTDESRELFNFVLEGAEQLNSLIQDLLVYSRLNRPATPEILPSQLLVDRALLALQSQVERSGATVEVGSLPVVFGNSAQLTQLFQHLIDNALKFRKDIPPHISITAEKGKAEWIFSVRDNGIGIAAEYFDRIFILFQKLHVKHTYSGTGAGLAICKRIVELHGGRIWVESEPSQGATFHFTLLEPAQPTKDEPNPKARA